MLFKRRDRRRNKKSTSLLQDAKAKGLAVKPAELGAQSKQILACREIIATLKAKRKIIINLLLILNRNFHQL